MRCAALRCAALRCAALRCAALLCYALHCSAMPCNAPFRGRRIGGVGSARTPGTAGGRRGRASPDPRGRCSAGRDAHMRKAEHHLRGHAVAAGQGANAAAAPLLLRLCRACAALLCRGPPSSLYWWAGYAACRAVLSHYYAHMLRYATLRYTTPRHATPRHATPRHATLRYATPRHATPCYAPLRPAPLRSAPLRSAPLCYVAVMLCGPHLRAAAHRGVAEHSIVA